MRPGDSGFTLLELMVALAVAAIVVLGARGAVAVVAQVAEHERDRATESLRIEAARTAIGRLLAAADLGDGPDGLGFNGLDAGTSARPRDEIGWVTLDPWMLGESGGAPTWVRLYVDPAAGLMVEYAGRSPDAPRGSVALLPEVTGMNVRYVVRLGGSERVLEAWTSSVRLPAAVEIEFETRAEPGTPDAVRLPLRVSLERRG